METEYRGSEVESTVRVGGVSIRVVRPGEPDSLLDDPEVARLNRDDDYMPYWAYLWPGAYLLAGAVAGRSWGGEKAIEIGCGLGLGGLVAMARGLDVTFTDYDRAAFAYVRRSAEANGFDPDRYSTRTLDWRERPVPEFPIILGADVLYERRLVPMVARLVADMLSPGGEALIADPYRVAAEEFVGVVESLGLRCVRTPIAVEVDGIGTIRGTLHRVTR